MYANNDDATRALYPKLPELQSQRLGMPGGQYLFDQLEVANLPWYESAGEQRKLFALSRVRARQMRWVRSQMVLSLSETERASITLYYFEAKTYRQAAQQLGLNASSVQRAVQRGIGKLREEAQKNQ